MKRAIIFGATGAIGSALIHTLISNNTEVLVLTRPDSQRNSNIPVHPLVTVRYCALNEMSALQNDSGSDYDVFYYLAWMGASGSGRNDIRLQADNIRYALESVELAKRFGCNTYVGAGSQAEYGRAEGVLKPDTPVFPENGYGMAKLCAGQMTRERSRQLGMKHIWVRILSVYGPNDGAASMVMSTIDKLSRGITPEFTAGEQLWDYLYSGDAAQALYLVGEKGVDGSVYVLGSGQAKPLKHYIQQLRDVTAPTADLLFGAIPYSEKQVMYLCADITALTDDTGWKPSTTFEDGIRLTLKSLSDI